MISDNRAAAGARAGWLPVPELDYNAGHNFGALELGPPYTGQDTYQVPVMRRRDEMGELTELFNEMTVKLARTRELEAQLYNAEKAVVVSRLASAIAHEIRNPLNYINLTLDHLRSKFKPEDAQKAAAFEKLTSQLKAEVARINQQISDFPLCNKSFNLSYCGHDL